MTRGFAPLPMKPTVIVNVTDNDIVNFFVSKYL